VAVRELVLAGLSPELRRQIERAAFEEFASPLVLGSPHLPGAGDRACIENERHYLVMQIRPARGQRAAIAVTLAGLLLQQPRWPSWLDIGTSVEGVRRLSHVVARLHRMGAILGDLNPGTVLVDAESAAEWAPVMLISWPPPSQFWSDSSNRALPRQVFPIAESSPGNAFAAPETLNGMYDERSDVYSLGAILYLLLTRYTPAPASLRELLPPHLFNYRISAELEQVVMRALSLDAADRYPSVYALLEALESIDLEKSRAEIVSTKENTQREPKATKVVEWLKRELIE
jgi:serine/threonine protein kinase